MSKQSVSFLERTKVSFLGIRRCSWLFLQWCCQGLIRVKELLCFLWRFKIDRLCQFELSWVNEKWLKSKDDQLLSDLVEFHPLLRHLVTEVMKEGQDPLFVPHRVSLPLISQNCLTICVIKKFEDQSAWSWGFNFPPAVKVMCSFNFDLTTSQGEYSHR